MEKAPRGPTVVATFATRENADAAIHALHELGYRHIWLGVTQRIDANTLGGTGGTVGAGRERVREVSSVFGRWLHRDRDRTLYDALREHGVEEEDARAIDGSVLEGNAVLVVADARSPRAVQRAIRDAGGTVRGAITEHDIEPDAMAASRAEAARRTGIRSAELDTNAVRTIREDVFIARPRHGAEPGPHPY